MCIYGDVIGKVFTVLTLQAAHFNLAFFLLLLKFMLMSWKTPINYCPVQNHCFCENTEHLFCTIANGGLLASLNQFN